jgi:hypothetical protein
MFGAGVTHKHSGKNIPARTFQQKRSGKSIPAKSFQQRRFGRTTGDQEVCIASSRRDPPAW